MAKKCYRYNESEKSLELCIALIAFERGNFLGVLKMGIANIGKNLARFNLVLTLSKLTISPKRNEGC